MKKNFDRKTKGGKMRFFKFVCEKNHGPLNKWSSICDDDYN